MIEKTLINQYVKVVYSDGPRIRSIKGTIVIVEEDGTIMLRLFDGTRLFLNKKIINTIKEVQYENR